MEIMFLCIQSSRSCKGYNFWYIYSRLAGICGLLLLVICIYVKYFRKKEGEKAKLPETSMALSTQDASGSAEYESSGSIGPATASAAGLTGIMVAKSTEFSYQELAKATNNFSLDSKIGQGGFGAVYCAELRGELFGFKNQKSIYSEVASGTGGRHKWKSRTELSILKLLNIPLILHQVNWTRMLTVIQHVRSPLKIY